MTNFRDSDDDDDDDMPPDSPAIPPDPTDYDRFLPPGFKPFGNDLGPPLVRAARENYFPYGFSIQGIANDPKFEDRIVPDGNLRKVFPEGNKVFNDFNNGEMKIEEDEDMLISATNLIGGRFQKNCSSFLEEMRTLIRITPK